MSTPDAMIGPGYVRAMAAYNAEMNRRLYAAADRLGDAGRRAGRGAFWGSIHGTLAHLLWGDLIWMHRFGAGEDPGVPLKASASLVADFDELRRRRERMDAEILAWADGLAPEDLAGEIRWYSGATGRDMARPKALCVTHLFNHQTHHRGQVHAMLTAAGEATGDTDLPFVLPDRT